MTFETSVFERRLSDWKQIEAIEMLKSSGFERMEFDMISPCLIYDAKRVLRYVFHEFRPDVNGTAEDGSTYLHVACRHFHATTGVHEAVEFLLRKGANPATVDPDGMLPVQLLYDGWFCARSLDALIRRGSPFRPEKTSRYFPRYDEEDEFFDLAFDRRRRLDVLWCFWYRVPHNSFPRLVAYFF